MVRWPIFLTGSISDLFNWYTRLIPQKKVQPDLRMGKKYQDLLRLLGRLIELTILSIE